MADIGIVEKRGNKLVLTVQTSIARKNLYKIFEMLQSGQVDLVEVTRYTGVVCRITAPSGARTRLRPGKLKKKS